MNLNGRLNRLEDAFGMNKTATDDFELTRPEALSIMATLMLHTDSEDEARYERLRILLDRHKRNAIEKHRTFQEVFIDDVFAAAASREEFCNDLDAVLARAEAYGV